MAKSMTKENLLCEMGEELNISYGKAEELLELIVFIMRHDTKSSKHAVLEGICKMAAENWLSVEKLFQSARDGQTELKERRSKIEMQRATKALHNSLRGILKFYLNHSILAI